MKLPILNQNGDTIVEVLIAMVILAFVLTGAYESSQYSINNIRNAENRITAVNLASSQIESLKSWSATGPSVPTGAFYMSGNTVTLIQNNSLPTQGVFMYKFSTPVQETNTNYTFTENVYWPDLNNNTLSHDCTVSNLSGCDSISVPYRTAI
jgi:prepilin-type N-terminal cleavage/methylation domain-containing protein